MANKLASENAAAGGDGRVITRADNLPPSLVNLLIEQLLDVYGLEFAKVDPIRERANATEQKIDSDELLAKWTAIYTDANALFKSLDEARKNEKRPFEKAVNDTFEPKTAPLVKIMEWTRRAADTYNRDKLQKQRAAEAAERERLAALERKAQEDAQIAVEFGDVAGAIASASAIAEVRQQADVQAAPAKPAEVARVRVEGGGVSTAQSVWRFSIEDYTKVDLNAIRHMIPPAEIDKAVAKIVKLQKGATKIDGVKVYEDVGTTFRK